MRVEITLETRFLAQENGVSENSFGQKRSLKFPREEKKGMKKQPDLLSTKASTLCLYMSMRMLWMCCLTLFAVLVSL